MRLLTWLDQTRGTPTLDSARQTQQHDSIPETQDAAIFDAERPIDIPLAVWDAHGDDGDGAVAGLSLPDTLPPSAEIDSTSRRRKMDSTQASTQSNAGRSYDQYRRQPSSGHALSSAQPPSSPKPVRTSSPPPDTLLGDDDDDEDDPAVRFDLLPGPATNKTLSPGGQDDSGYVDFGSLAHFRHAATQRTAQSPTQNLPETPAPPQNPFRNSRSQLLSTSQLFRATQFSSPIKLASPTSSRPSPADFPANSISPNPVISSPLKARGLRSSPAVDITSSPEILPGTISSRLNDRASSPVNTASTGNPVVPESSHDTPARKRSVPEPMSTYEPMRKSQERRSTSDGKSDPLSSGDDDDVHDSFDRRRKAKSKKEAALRQLTAISFPRPQKAEDVEIPSTSQRKRQSQAEADLGRRHGENLRINNLDDAEEIEDPPVHPVERGFVAEDEESTQSDVEEEPVPAVDPTPSTVPVLPRSSTKSATQFARDSGIESMSNGDAIPETSPTSRHPEPPPEMVVALSTEPAPLQPEAKSTPNFQSSPPAFSTRARKGNGRKGYPRAPSPTSSLSNLASTPLLPSTDLTGHGSAVPASSPTESTIVASSSPVIAQTRRRDARPKPSKLKTTGSAESLRQSTRKTRRDSTSTDELARSVTATPTFEQSLRVSRASMSRSASRSGRGAMKPPPAQRDQKLFENMAFAISFQSRKPGETNDQYNVRMEFSTSIERRIRLAGGRILENGFDELFDALSLGTTPLSTPASSPGSTSSTSTTPPEITLTPEGRTTGFTALIADGHSRKVKYMQALALGLPCVAARWATTCLDRGALVDWTPYLLCAGQSAFLGDAVRSRTLASYDAASARLGEVVARRERLLSGSRILAVVRRAREGKKMAYVFLARVLGASLTRVFEVEEARGEMKAAEERGRPFDWVYVDGKAEEEALFAAPAAAAAGGGKKRKRAAPAAAASFAAAVPPVKRVRTLSDELVIQSLILGRLIEEGEMEG